jgi:uncharacterized SAM-binding protein YcdF (DUF218 family)
MIVKPVLLSLAVPPTCFLYVTLLGLLLRRRRGAWLAPLGVACLLVCALPVTANTLLHALETGLPRTPSPGAAPEAIVILGGDVQRDAEPPFALPGYLTLGRLRAGAVLWRATRLPVLVTGGTVLPDLPPVAQIMAASLRSDFRVPVTWVEDRSATTWENAFDSAAILKTHGIGSVYVVTNGWHMRRALIAFRKAGLTVTAAPVSITAPRYASLRAYLPGTAAWRTTYYAMHEWIGCAWYALR